MAFNDFLSDAMVTHDVSLLRFDAKVRRQVLGQLRSMQDNIVSQLDNVNFANVAKRARLEGLLEQVDGIVKQSFSGTNRHMLSEMTDLAGLEQSFQTAKMNQLFGVDIISASLTPQVLRVLAKDSLVFGAPAKEWWGRQSATMRKRFGDEMRQGFLLGETTQDLVRRVRGSATGTRHVIETAAGKLKSVNTFSGGIMDATTREATTLVRTSVNSISNEVRLKTYMGNQDVIGSVMAQVTLDARTSSICQSHGAIPDEWTLPDFEPVGGSNPFTGPPPWHFNCRSSLLPITKSFEELQGQKATRSQRSVARKLDNNVPKRTRSSMNGQVPRSTGYDAWLKKQPAAIQLEVLGPGKRKLWKAGKLNLTQMIDQTGRPLTLHQIQELPSNKNIPLKLPPRQPIPKLPKQAPRPPVAPKPQPFIAPPTDIPTVTLEGLRTLKVGDTYKLNGEVFKVLTKTRTGIESVHWSTRTGKFVTPRNKTKLTFGTPPVVPPTPPPAPPLGPTTTIAGAPKAVFVPPSNYGTLKVGDIWKDAQGNVWKVGTITKRGLRALPWSVKSNRWLSLRNATSFGFSETAKIKTVQGFTKSRASSKATIKKLFFHDKKLGHLSIDPANSFTQQQLLALEMGQNAMAKNGFNNALGRVMLKNRTRAKVFNMGPRQNLRGPFGETMSGRPLGAYWNGLQSIGIAEEFGFGIADIAKTWIHELGHHLDFTFFRQNFKMFGVKKLSPAANLAKQGLDESWKEMLAEYKAASTAVKKKLGLRGRGPLTASQQRNNWTAIEGVMKGHSQTSYALHDGLEWFAETFAAYFNLGGSRKLMAEWQPKTFAFYEKLFSKEMEILWREL